MDINHFEHSDRPALSRIYLDARARTFAWTDPALLRPGDFDRDTRGERIWVARVAGVRIGFISVWAAENFIHNLFVHPDHAGKGAGSALLRHGLAHIGRPAALKCDVRNTVARDFYLSRGWRIESLGDGPDGRYALMQFRESDPIPVTAQER